MNKNKNRVSLSRIFLAASVVGLCHFGITGAEDAINSAYLGLAAGWGALAYSAFLTIRDRIHTPEKDFVNGPKIVSGGPI